MEQTKRRDDRIFDPLYVSDLTEMDREELRARRTESAEFEAELSYARRLLQGKLDILRSELERRRDGGEPGIEALIGRLPDILADEGNSAMTRHTTIGLPKNSEKARREVERVASETVLANVNEITPADLTDMVERLSDAESKTSDERRKVQEVMDLLNAELVRRYRDGEEDVSRLLSN